MKRRGTVCRTGGFMALSDEVNSPLCRFVNKRKGEGMGSGPVNANRHNSGLRSKWHSLSCRP